MKREKGHPVLQAGRRGAQASNGSYYVIHLTSIVRRLCVVPDCSKRSCMVRGRAAAGGDLGASQPRFYINPFLWARR